MADTATKLLRFLPPETAHGLTLWALEKGFGPKTPADDPALNITLFGKKFSNPIGLAAGGDKDARGLKGWARMGFGFVEAGTVTLHPRAGNPRPRIWRFGDGHLVNWMGFPGGGLAPFAGRLKAFQDTPERKTLALGVSIVSVEGAVDDLRRLAAACAPLADYLTLDISCPNVNYADGGDPLQAARAQVKAVMAEAGGRPVMLKIRPTRDEAALKITVEGLMEAGASGIIATNTVPFDKKTLLSALPFAWPRSGGKPVGGYSGPAQLDTTCWMVERTRALLGTGVPVMGVGGIQSAPDALRVMKAGADAVQVYTGLVYRGAGLLAEIKAGLTGTPPQ